jgi:YVTN family beta-propeller protein
MNISFSETSGCGGAGGGTFDMEISFYSDRPWATEIQFDLIFSDAVMTFLDVRRGSQAALAGKNISATRVGSGMQRIRVDGNTRILENGIAAIARFQLVASARLGRYPVLLSNATARSAQGSTFSMPEATKDVEVIGRPMLTAISPRMGSGGTLMVLSGMNFGSCTLGLRASFRNDAQGYRRDDVPPIEVNHRRAVVLVPNDANGLLKVSVSVAGISIDPSQAGNFQADSGVPYSSLSTMVNEPTALESNAVPSGAAVDSQTNLAYVADNFRRTITSINLATGMRVDTIINAGRPVRVATDPMRGQVVVTTDNNFLLVMKRQIGGTLQLIGQPIAVGLAPLGVAIDTVGNRAVTANSGSNNASIVDLSIRQLIANVPVGREPVAVAIQGNHALVTNAGDNSLSDINLDTRAVTTLAGVGLRPASVDVLPESNTAIVGTNTGLLVYNMETRVSTFLLNNQGIDNVAVHPGRGIAEVVNNATQTITTIIPGLADQENPDNSLVGIQSLGGLNVAGLAINPLTNTGILAGAPAANSVLEQAGSGGFSRMEIPPSLNFPRLLPNSSGEAEPLAAIAISNGSVEMASLQTTAIGLNGQQLLSSGMTNPFTTVLKRQEQVSTLDFQLLGDPVRSENYWLKVVTPNPGLRAFFMTGDFSSSIVGAEEIGQLLNDAILPAVPANYQSMISLINTSMLPATVNMDLIGNDGVALQSAARSLPKYGALQGRMEDIFPVIPSRLAAAGGAYVHLRSSMPVRA